MESKPSTINLVKVQADSETCPLPYKALAVRLTVPKVSPVTVCFQVPSMALAFPFEVAPSKNLHFFTGIRSAGYVDSFIARVATIQNILPLGVSH